jgi:hypothetical protein
MVLIHITKVLLLLAMSVDSELEDIVNSLNIFLLAKEFRKKLILAIKMTKPRQKAIMRIQSIMNTMISSNSTIMRMKMITTSMDKRMRLPSSTLKMQEVVDCQNTCIPPVRESPSLQRD